MNLVRINDWPLRRFIIFVLTLQICFIGVISLKNYLNFPFLRETLGFVILTFIPGFLILRILRIHNIGNIRSILFSIGISISFIMILTLFINFLYPILGISDPISPKSLISTIFVSLFGLVILTYIRDESITSSNIETDINEFFNPYVLLVVLIFFVGLMGIVFVNFWSNNFLLMLFLFLVSIVPILVLMEKIPKRCYPLIIYLISLGLLFHISLFSKSVVGTDIFGEVYLSNTVYNNQFWVYSTGNIVNSALSVALLPAVYAKVCNLNIVAYFKVISPFFFSLVPVGLYYLYGVAFNQNQLNKKEIFLSVFFVIAMSQFYMIIAGIGKQQLAELFYILILILIVDDIQDKAHNFLLILFSISLIFSHYSMAIIFLMFITLFFILDHIIIRRERLKPKISSTYVLLFLVLTMAWILYTSNASIMGVMVSIGKAFLDSFNYFLQPETSASVQILTKSSLNMTHMIYRYLYYLFILFIMLGGLKLLSTIFKRLNSSENFKISKYELLTIINFLMLIFFVLVPVISYKFGFERSFQIIILVIAPLMILGFKNIIEMICKIALRLKIEISKNQLNKILAILLSLFFLFNSGFIYATLNDNQPNSVPLSLKDSNYTSPLKNGGIACLKIQTLDTSQLKSGKWFMDHYDSSKHVYTTFGSNELIFYGINITYAYLDSSSKLKGYFYYNGLNKELGIEFIKLPWGINVTNINKTDVEEINKLNKIYTSAESDVYVS